MSKFEPKSPKGSVPNGQSQFAVRGPIRWFKCKLKPPKKHIGLLCQVILGRRFNIARIIFDVFSFYLTYMYTRIFTWLLIARVQSVIYTNGRPCECPG